VEDSIESLRWAALETIDRQVPELKSEIEKGKRAFQAKIARLKSQTQELEEEGRAAAMTLKAYGSSRLSIDS